MSISAYPLLSAYFLTTYCYKRMRLITRVYGNCWTKIFPGQSKLLHYITLHYITHTEILCILRCKYLVCNTLLRTLSSKKIVRKAAQCSYMHSRATQCKQAPIRTNWVIVVTFICAHGRKIIIVNAWFPALLYMTVYEKTFHMGFFCEN